MLEVIIVTCLVTLVAVYTVRQLWKFFRGEKSACGDCAFASNCNPAKNSRPACDFAFNEQTAAGHELNERSDKIAGNTCDCHCRPLSQMKIGARGRIVRMQGGGRLQQRLSDMGLHPGCDVYIIMCGKNPDGPILVNVGNSNLALGRGISEKVFVNVN